MQSRRIFLKSLAWGGLFLTKRSQGSPRALAPSIKPVVVSTWNFGLAANKGAWDVLSIGGKAIDAVEAGVRITEADPKIQTVGYGGFPDREGRVTLDACVMDEKGNAGSVAAMENIIHAASVARKVMEKTPHVLLVGQGATDFALSQGFEKQELLTPESREAWEKWLKKSKYQPEINVENRTSRSSEKAIPQLPGSRDNHDTIGMLALDSNGDLSGACTTSGLAFKMKGRVGDSPILGAGLFVDNEVGAATSTGVGEATMRICGTHTVVELMRQGLSPEEACKQTVERVVKQDAAYAQSIQLGFLAMNKNGEVGAYCLQEGFNYAVYSPQIPNQLIDGKHYF